MASPTITPTRQHHKTLLGKDPTSAQLHLYDKFPEFRGLSDHTLDPETLEAVIVMGLTFGSLTGNWQDRVYLLAPVAHEKWVVDEFNVVCDRVFKTCKNGKDPVRIANSYMFMFKRIVITGRLLQLPEEPAQWVSFGFAAEDVLPDWMGSRLSSSSK